MKKKRELSVDSTLLNIISPLTLKCRKTDLDIGENTGRIYGIVRYASDYDYGWLSKITNIPGTIAAVNFRRIDSGTFLETVNQNIKKAKERQENAKSELEEQRAEQEVENGREILRQVDQNQEAVGLLGITLLPLAGNEESLKRIEEKMRGVCSSVNCSARILPSLQKEGYKHISPTYAPREDINNVIENVAPLRTVMGGFPFSTAGFNDDAGYYFAKDTANGLIILDLWKRGADRINSNIVITGDPGVGKSTIVKNIILSEYMMGTKCIIIDPEREYRDLCMGLNGDWINAGGSQSGRINPLQVRSVPRDEESTERIYIDEGNGIGALAIYLKHLELFFRIYLSGISEIEIALLKKALIELYRDFNITWDTDVSRLRNDEFPFMEHLVGLLRNKAAEDPRYATLVDLLEDTAEGSDSFLWNGPTTVATHSNLVCIDTNDLQDTSDKVKCSQYFNITTWAWNQVIESKEQRVMIFCDEAYLMIDPKVPQTLVFLRNTAKRIRKQEGGLCIISHSVEDFLSESVRMYGQPLLDNPCYKILMGTDGKNLMDIKKLYQLTEAEEDLLQKRERGRGLMIIGNKRLNVKFDIPQYRLDYMGKAGGR